MPAAIARSHPNIAFIKYWGNRDQELRIPSNGSISMNLDGLFTRTSVEFDPEMGEDCLILNNAEAHGSALERVSLLLNRVRQLSGVKWMARVESSNNFPAGTGIASSASAFAALSLAAASAAGLRLGEAELSRLARRASGSACRSVPAGFVEWQAGGDDRSSFAFSIAPPDHWLLADCVAVVSRLHKQTDSTAGHILADTSPLQPARVADSPRRLDVCRKAIMARDFDALAEIVELDSHLMHAVMLTSSTRLQYWQPATVEIMQRVVDWRKAGVPVCFTVDAGPNVHVVCPAEKREQVAAQLADLPGVQEVLVALPGGPVQIEQTSR